MVDQRGGGLGGDDRHPSGRGSGERTGDGGGEGGREDGGDAGPSRRVGSLNGGSDGLSGRVDSGSRHNNGRRVGSGGRHDDNGRRLRARVAVLVGVLAVANVDSGATGDTNVNTGAGEVVIA